MRIIELLNRARRLLGVHDILLVLAFLTANSFVEVVTDLLEAPASKIMWLVALCAATSGFAVREARRTGQVGDLTADSFGVYAERSLTQRRAAVVVLGLDSSGSDSALARLLRHAPNLELLAMVGTHETRASNICERVTGRLMAATGRTLPAEHIRVWDHNNAMSVGDHAEAVAEAIAWIKRHGVPSSDIVVDISAGRRMAGFGALQAADAEQVETQYLANVWDHMTHQPLDDQLAFRVISPYWGTPECDPASQLETSPSS